MLRQAILQALEDKYQAQISEADATIKIYLSLLYAADVLLYPQNYLDKFL